MSKPEIWTPEKITKYRDAWATLAPLSFWMYRQFIHPDMFKGWWIEEMAGVLMEFYADMIAGRRPKIILMAPPQHSKGINSCHPVLTTKGWSTHGALKIGDEVFHPSGRTTRVIATTKEWPTRMRVELTNGEVLWCHEPHEFTVFDNRRKRQRNNRGKPAVAVTIEAQELLRQGVMLSGRRGKRGSRYRWHLPQVQPLQGSAQRLPVAPYALGVWLGNGTRDRPVITQGLGDEAPIEAIKRLGYGTSREYEQWSNSKVYYFCAADRSLGPELKLLGFMRPRCDKFIPQQYLLAPIVDRLELLAGLIDTDGYIYHKNGRVVFVTTDKQLMQSFCQLLATFGWHGSVDKVLPVQCTVPGGIQGRKNVYHIGFSPTLYIPCRLPRKQMQRVFTQSKPVAIKSIRRVLVSKRVGKCITVDAPDGLYLVGHSMVPTHNSVTLTDFISWVAGRNPEMKTIYASYSDDLGVIANTRLQRIFASDQFKVAFPEFGFGGAVNTELIEYNVGEGSFRNVSIGGQVTGKGLNLGVIDDAVKNRAEAESELIRNKTWNWFTDDFMSRFAEVSGLCLVLTRWHLFDLAGRMIEMMPDVRVLRYPAIAEEDEPHRRRGEPLFPELKSLEFLLERKAVMSHSSWLSEYQQRPVAAGGSLFKRDWFTIVGAAPSDCRWVRRWDIAGSKNKEAAYTCGVLMGHSAAEKKFYIADVVRDQLEGDGVKRLIRQTSAIDMVNVGKRNYSIWLPQDPGAAGKILAQDFITMLTGYDVHSELETGDKETRARPFAAQVEAGNVKLVAGPWIKSYIEELICFPSGKFADQVDASSGAFGVLIMNPPMGKISMSLIRGEV